MTATEAGAWPLPLRGKWLKWFLVGLVVASPLLKTGGSLLDVPKFYLACGLLSGLAALGVSLLDRFCNRMDVRERGERVVRGLALAGGVAAFLLWIQPTRWREWRVGDTVYRQHRLSGRVLELMECGCDWYEVAPEDARSIRGVWGR